MYSDTLFDKKGFIYKLGRLNETMRLAIREEDECT